MTRKTQAVNRTSSLTEAWLLLISALHKSSLPKLFPLCLPPFRSSLSSRFLLKLPGSQTHLLSWILQSSASQSPYLQPWVCPLHPPHGFLSPSWNTDLNMSFRGHMASLCLQDPGDIPSQVTCDLPWSGPALSTDKGLKNICGLSALNRKRRTPPEPLESDSTAGGRWEQQAWAWAFRRVGRGQRLDLTV